MLTFLFCLALMQNVKSQQDKNYYLIDSIDVTSLSKFDKTLMDSIMLLYYKADKDTTKLQLLDVLVNNCSETIWPKYNNYVNGLSNKFLNHPEKYSKKELQLIKGTKANTYVNYGVLLVGEGNYDEAIKNYELGLAGFREVGDTLGISNTLYNIATVYVRMNKVDKGLDLLNENAVLLARINNERALLTTYSTMASVYRNRGQIEKSLDYLYKCLKLSEKNEPTPFLCSVLLNIGTIQFDLKNSALAMKNYERALGIAEKLNNLVSISKALEHMALVYHQSGDVDKALELNFKSLKIKETLKNQKGMAYTYGNIALNYMKKGDNLNTEVYFLKAITILEQSNEKTTLANTLKNFGEYYESKNDLSKAKFYGQKALSIAKELGYPENIQNSAELLKSVYIKSGDWRQGFEMAELASKMRDSIHNSSTQKAMLKNQIEYAYQKEKLTDSLNFAKQKELKDILISEQEAELRVERTTRYGLIGILILIGILTTVLYKSYRSKLKTNQVISEQKELLEKKNSENEILLSEIHHRVKNNLQVISSLLSLQERSTENEGAKSAILEGKERVKSMELVHKMLYQNSKFSGIEMQDYVNKLSLGLIESFGLSKNEVELNTNFEPLTLDVDTAVPLGLILNELIVNSLKYAKNATEKLQLKIELHLDNNNALHLNIADNGIGKISDIEKSNSFGLKIVKALIRQLNGAMEIKDDQGLKYSIALKNYKLIA